MSVQLYNPTTDELTQVAGEEFNDTVIRVSALPSASADLINETYLLVADQTGYARGGIYQCQYVDDAFTWVLVNGSGMTVDAVEDGNMNGVTSNAVADKFATLGTASEKDFTNFVSPTDSGLPISSSVFSAITNALYGAYHPSGSKTIAELDSSLLIQANVGNVYKITDSGVTTDLFIGGAGQTINIGDNAVVVYDTSGETFKYALQSGVVDLSEYQTKELPNGAMIEDIIPTDASASNKLVTENDIYENIGSNSASGSSTIYEISGVKSATRQSGALVLTARAGETIILTLANNASDNTSASNYSAIRLGGTYKKIQALNYDYTNEKLYVTLGNNSTIECCQLNGAKNDLSITTVSSVPTTNTISITIKENVTESAAQGAATNATGVTGTVKWNRRGHVVTVSVQALTLNGTERVSTIASGLPKPLEITYSNLNSSLGSATCYPIAVYSDGALTIHANSGALPVVNGTYGGMTYLTDDF